MDRAAGVDRRTAAVAAATGAVAHLLGYLVTYLARADRVAERLRGLNVVAGLIGAAPVPTWKAVGWLFYNAHLVGTEVPALAGTRTVNFVAEAGTGSVPLLYLLPPVVLLGAGATAAVLSGAAAVRPGAAAGALVALGYLPAALAGALLVAHRVGPGRVAPDPVAAVAVAGLVYPAALGAAGGAMGGAVGGRA
ncbi:MAG: transporter [Haloferacaceae archaeon]